MIGLLTIATFALFFGPSLYDALGFPRGGTPQQQAAFHRNLYVVQGLAWAAYLAATFLVAGWQAWPFWAASAWWWAHAVHDLCYWFWRLALGLSTWADWNPFGSWRYWKRWNLLYRVVAAVSGATPSDPLPKWADTTTRLVGLASGLAFLLAFS